jgi:endonuclease/exonuclease/phosphatase family metal-dependent hydrolase
MGCTIRLLMVLVFAGAGLASAAEVQPGDQVRFITREQHIPAHPAPGDTRVHLRFVSSSEATVLRVHRATGWIEVRDEPVQGTENTGWVALSRVVDTDVYDVHVDDRPQGSLNGQQNTGFAFKRGLTVVRQPDFTALDVQGDGRLRYGARIDLTHNGQTIQLMSVHLKSGCFENRTTSSDCPMLLAQVPVLEGWIHAAARGTRPFVVLGGFNRRVNQPGDRVWADLDDGNPASVDLTALTQDMPISCQDNEFTEFINHIVVDPRVLPWVDRSSFRQITYHQADKAVWSQLSDHCPVEVELWVRRAVVMNWTRLLPVGIVNMLPVSRVPRHMGA